jgi:hypothetical protein
MIVTQIAHFQLFYGFNASFWLLRIFIYNESKGHCVLVLVFL